MHTLANRQKPRTQKVFLPWYHWRNVCKVSHLGVAITSQPGKQLGQLPLSRNVPNETEDDVNSHHCLWENVLLQQPLMNNSGHV